MKDIRNVLDDNMALEDEFNGETEIILTTNQFIILSIVTLGIYKVWWMYKAWCFFQQKEKTEIMPALRAIFSIFFLIQLLNRILDFAKEKEYSNSYSSIWLFVGFIIFNLFGHLPFPFVFFSLIGFVFLLPPFKALNYAKKNSKEFRTMEQSSFNTRQIFLIIIGLIVLILSIFGYIHPYLVKM